MGARQDLQTCTRNHPLEALSGRLTTCSEDSCSEDSGFAAANISRCRSFRDKVDVHGLFPGSCAAGCSMSWAAPCFLVLASLLLRRKLFTNFSNLEDCSSFRFSNCRSNCSVQNNI